MIHRLKALVEYDGTNYHGWQIQQNQPSIQGTLAAAWSRIHGSPVTIHGAGRTDAGVHAQGQVLHCDVEKNLPSERWHQAVNALLPPDIRIRSVQFCDSSFHSQYSAHSKTYGYRFWRGRTVSPFWYRYVLAVPENLAWDAMYQAATAFPGTHDFVPFTVADRETETTIRTITAVEWKLLTPDILSLEFTGTGFLRSMVRRMVGALLEVGRRRLPSTAIADILITRRPAVFPTASAKGLTLLRVDY